MRRGLIERREKPRRDITDTGFLPNLCSVYALFLWVLAGGLLSVMLCVADEGLTGLSWAALGLVSFEVQWIVLGSAAMLCRLRPLLSRMTPTRAGLLSYSLVLLCSVLVATVGQWLLAGVGRPAIDFWQVANHLVIAAVIAGVTLRFLYLQQQLRIRQQSELSARIQALQSRIQPHFLFNSMNSIASLIAVDPDRAERVVENLCDLFRVSLAELALVPLSRELALCRGYIDIEQLRLDQRLSMHWVVDHELEALEIPSLILQPLIENAIRHGVEPAPEGGTVEISVLLEGQAVVLKVSNSRAPGAPGSPPGNRMALDNIRHRLQAHYGREAELLLSATDAEFVAEIRIPRRLCRADV